MAGGIDWFRWHHGSVTDPKFALVARKAGASLPDVLAVWAYLLEKASASAERGSFGDVDAEAIDCLFNFPSTETRTADIMSALDARRITRNGRIAKWEERQPKREDETAAERKRRQRERDHELELGRAVTPNESRDVTPEKPCVTQKTADVTHGHDRGEERREEKNSPSLRSGEKTRKRVAPVVEVAASVLVEAGFSEDLAAEFIAHKARLKAPLTGLAWRDHCREAQKAGWTVADAAEKTIARSWKGFEAKYVADERPPARAAPKSFAQADSEAKAARIFEMTGGILGKKPADVIEVFDVPLKAIR